MQFGFLEFNNNSISVFSWPFSGESESYALIFPKVLYPLNNITICCSIGLTVAIALERYEVEDRFFIVIIFIFRYCAVCHPFYYRESVRSTSVDCRVAKYVIPVIVFAVILNIPKFFETKLFYIPVNDTLHDTPANNGDDVQFILTYDVTELRKNPDYIR